MQAVYEINEKQGKIYFHGYFKKSNDLLLREIVIRLRGNEPYFITCKKKVKNAFELYENDMKKLETDAKMNPKEFIK